MGIHCYVLDVEGRVAFAVLLNSHHKSFADTNPTGVLLKVLGDKLVKKGGVLRP